MVVVVETSLHIQNWQMMLYWTSISHPSKTQGGSQPKKNFIGVNLRISYKM